MNCRHCAQPLVHVFLDLGFAPPSNAYVTAQGLQRPEAHFPLKLFVCDACWLVQTEDHAQAVALFDSEYAYFSSVSRSWLDHAARYCEAMTHRLGLHAGSHVVEVAANDGYLLRNFVAAGIPCLGVEPTAGTAAAARAQGIEIVEAFFGEPLARLLAAQGKQADLIVGNNVFAHVPDINDFALGLRLLLKPGGTVTLEFPHLARLIAECQFDTVYHEHFSYLSLHTTCAILRRAGLRVIDVEELPTHGGSLRVYAAHEDDARAGAPAVAAVLAHEESVGLRSLAIYQAFQASADAVKNGLLRFLLDCKAEGRKVGAYGAAAKGNTLLNYAGVKPDLLPYVCDAAPSKQGKYTPGGHIPILHPDVLRQRRPDIVLVLPWNLHAEIKAQLAFVGDWGGKVVRAVPRIEVL